MPNPPLTDTPAVSSVEVQHLALMERARALDVTLYGAIRIKTHEWIVLAHRITEHDSEWIVWTAGINPDDPKEVAFYWGHYHTNRADAVAQFQEKVR